MAKTIKIKGTKPTTNASPKGAKAKPKAPQEAPKATEAPKGKLSKPQEAPQAPKGSKGKPQAPQAPQEAPKATKEAKEAKPTRPKLADVPKGERTTEKLRSMYGARVVCRWQNDGIDYPGTIIAPMPHHHLDGAPAPTVPDNHVRVFFRAFPEYGWPLETWADIRTENIRAPGEPFEEAPKATEKEAPKAPKGRKLAKGSDANEKGGKLAAKKAARKPTTRKR